jgi:hypothetical protein
MGTEPRSRLTRTHADNRHTFIYAQS